MIRQVLDFSIARRWLVVLLVRIALRSGRLVR